MVTRFLKLSRSKNHNHRQGAMLVLIAITLPLVVIMAAFALDVAWMQFCLLYTSDAADE